MGDNVLLCAVQTPLYLSTGQALQQVFDLSHNGFNGSLPSFLAQQAVPAWTQQGIFLQASLRFATPDRAVSKPSMQDSHVGPPETSGWSA